MQSPVKVCSNQAISAASKYRTPQGANLAGWYNGRVAFFRAEEPNWWARQRNRRFRFAMIPDNSGNWELSLPEYIYRNGSGHFYGEPKWTFARGLFKSEDQASRVIPF